MLNMQTSIQAYTTSEKTISAWLFEGQVCKLPLKGCSISGFLAKWMACGRQTICLYQGSTYIQLSVRWLAWGSYVCHQLMMIRCVPQGSHSGVYEAAEAARVATSSAKNALESGALQLANLVHSVSIQSNLDKWMCDKLTQCNLLVWMRNKRIIRLANGVFGDGFCFQYNSIYRSEYLVDRMAFQTMDRVQFRRFDCKSLSTLSYWGRTISNYRGWTVKGKPMS